ncbi:protein FAM222B [Platysternon megacephalum]|uniref:Protein FAM222B n=1 Tax=Platysternon megacephalum TaxID=55544 RepID=A0A4D9DYS7_9SAUR|nr:protein FAM222B [Platysternon megacephalum]
MALVKGPAPRAQLTASEGTRIGGNVACLFKWNSPPHTHTARNSGWRNVGDPGSRCPRPATDVVTLPGASSCVAANERHRFASCWPWCWSGETEPAGAAGGGEEPCGAGAALVCGEQPLPVCGPIGCCPKLQGKTAARGLGAQLLDLRQAGGGRVLL